MARLVVKSSFVSPTVQGRVAHLLNLVGYIATREGVELNETPDPNNPSQDEWKRRTDLPPTEKQERLIRQLLEDFPDCKESLEYEDYLTAPSMATASEFISRTSEDRFFEMSSREGYIQYLATRPGAERDGQHGLWGPSDEPLDLDETAYHVAHHNGNVWTHIISLRREDAIETGMENAESWRELVRSQAGTIAEAMGIPLTDLRWYAAFHNESHHPHIHMVAYSVGAEPYLGKKGLQQIKSGLANEIFREELLETFQAQTQYRDDLTNQWRSMLAEGADLHQVEVQIQELAKFLSCYKGKAVYGYLPGQQRELVNRIVDTLGKNPRIQSLYDDWYTQRDKITGIYKGMPEERLPLSENKTFKALKNAVIKTAAEIVTGAASIRALSSLDTLSYDAIDTAWALPDPPEDPDPPEPLLKTPEEWLERYPYPGQHDIPDSPIPQEDLESPEPLQAIPDEWLERYPYPGQHDVPDYLDPLEDPVNSGAMEQASTEFPEQQYERVASAPPEDPAGFGELEHVSIEHSSLPFDTGFHTAVEEKKNGWWTENYKYARRLLYGSSDQDPNPEAAFTAMRVESATGNPLAQHDLGRMLLQGIGTTADPEAAAVQFKKALVGFKQEAQGDRPAYWQYRTGKMYAMGYGTDQDFAQAAEWYQKAVGLDNPFAAYALAGLHYRGQGVELDYEKAYRLYEIAANDEKNSSPYAKWELAKMSERGIGTVLDPETAATWYTGAYEGFKALESRQIDDKLAYRLGYMEYKGLGTVQDIPAAMKHFERAAQLGNPSASYYLAKIYLSGETIPRDIPKAVELLDGLKENEFYAPQAAYHLGRLYLEEPDVLDIGKGISNLEFAAQQDNPYAAYKLARILSTGELVAKDVPRAVELLEGLKANETFAAQAAFQLGKLYLEEPDVLDIGKGISNLEFAAERDNPYAAYKLARILSTGELVSKDVPRAVELLKGLKGNEAFTAQAAFHLGKLQLSEPAVWDAAQGVNNLKFAAGKGNHFAAYALGRVYFFGQGEYHDRELGLKYLHSAANQGNEYASKTLEQIQHQEIRQEVFAALGLLRLFERSLKPKHHQQQKLPTDLRQRQKELEKKQAQGMQIG